MHIDVRDTNTVLLRHVPVHAATFSKARTNLLLKRPAPGMPFLALVDEDLKYVGGDESIKGVFAPGPAEKGWRPLALGTAGDRDLELVTEDALHALGFGPALKPVEPAQLSAAGGLLARFGAAVCVTPEMSPTIGRDEEIDAILACLTRRQPCMPLIVGDAGTGKTNLVLGIARRLSGIVAIDVLDLLSAASSDAARERCWGELLREIVESKTVVAVEQIELIFRCVPRGDLLLSRALDQGARILASTSDPGCVRSDALLRRVQMVRLDELPPADLVEIVSLYRAGYALEINDNCINACVSAACGLPGHFPGKALTLLDAAVSHARVGGACVVAADDILAAAGKVNVAT